MPEKSTPPFRPAQEGRPVKTPPQNGESQADRRSSRRAGETASSKGQGKPPTPPKRSRTEMPQKKWINLVMAFVLFLGALMIVGSISGWLGYRNGENQRFAYTTVTADAYVAEQFELAVQDFTNGSYTLAKQRLDYILSVRPDFEPALALLVDVSLILNITATPTAIPPTATPSPTPDLRPAEDQFQTILALVALQQWDDALDTLANLRKTNPSYKIIEVDGLVYLCLRHRGIDKILNRGDLEGGIYDFTLAEAFGPLDGETENYRLWARLYLLGNAFWGAYPDEAAYYYGQLVSAAPNITDASGVSAFYRYWASLAQQGEFLIRDEKWCEASEKYVHVLGAWDQAYVHPTATWVYEKCVLSSATPTWTITSTAMTETPTMTTTPEPGPPTDTPIPTDTPKPGPPTDTPVPVPTDTLPAPTDTPQPQPTDTPQIPTDTPETVPTDTSEPPPTDTPEPPPTDTPEPPPTETPTSGRGEKRMYER